MEFTKLSRIQKVGDSMAFLIPSDYCKALDLWRGDYVVSGAFGDGRVIFRKLTDKELQALKPTEIDYGEPATTGKKRRRDIFRRYY